jgi:putative membrane protein
VKHYLRGEEGILYEDLYHLTKYLPAYALPAGKPLPDDMDASSDNASADSAEKGLPPPVTSPIRTRFSSGRSVKGSTMPDGTPKLLPARNPPEHSLWDVFPFTLLVKPLTKRGWNLGGRRAHRARAHLGLGRDPDGEIVDHNIPLEITLYLVSASENRWRRDY